MLICTFSKYYIIHKAGVQFKNNVLRIIIINMWAHDQYIINLYFYLFI